MKSTLLSLLLSILWNSYLFYSILYLPILYFSWLSCPYLYLCIHAYIHICYKYFSIHVCLTIRIYIFVNIYLSKLCYQYICLDILAFMQLSVHTCLYILFYTFTYTSWTIYFFLILLYIPFLVHGILPKLSFYLSLFVNTAVYYMIMLLSGPNTD